MGWCPLPTSSGEPGYSIASANVWGFCLLVLFAGLASVATFKKSLPLAISYAALLAISVLMLIARILSDLGGFRNNG